MRRTRVAIAVIGSAACGPLVPTGADGDTGDGSSEATSATRTDAEGGDVDDGQPNPSDPSAPGDTVDPDTGITVTATATASTTAPIPEGCGDDVVDPEEECDDGNIEDGDACSSQCTITVEVAWTATYDGPASSFDVAHDVVVGPDDSIYVVGKTHVVSSDVWVQQYFADGSAGWSFSWDGLEGLADEGHAIAWTPAGKLAIVGSTESMATGDDILVLLLDPVTQAVVWSRVFDGPGAGAGEYDEVDVGNDVAVDPAGNVVVAATMRVGSGDYDAWIAEISADGVELRWSIQRTGRPGEREDAQALTVDAAGSVTALLERDGDDSIMRFFTDDGTDAGVSVTHPFAGHDMARRPDGGFALVGVYEEDFDADMVVVALDDGLNQWWSATDAGNGDDDAVGVAAGPASEVAAVGTKGAQGEQSNAWIRVFRDDGTPWWGASHNGDANLEDTFRAAAFDSTGAVIAVGSETVLGQQTNAIVRKYIPL